MQGSATQAANEDSGISKRIREAREARGWTQEEFAQRIGSTPDTVADWESGARDPFGQLQEPGWEAAGLAVSTEPEPGRGYEALLAKADG